MAYTSAWRMFVSNFVEGSEVAKAVPLLAIAKVVVFWPEQGLDVTEPSVARRFACWAGCE